MLAKAIYNDALEYQSIKDTFKVRDEQIAACAIFPWYPLNHAEIRCLPSGFRLDIRRHLGEHIIPVRLCHTPHGTHFIGLNSNINYEADPCWLIRIGLAQTP